MSTVLLLTKVVIIDLFCFDIAENVFESNIDLILRFLDGCIGYCCTAQRKIWLIWFLCIGYCGTAQLTIDWPGSLWIFSIFCFFFNSYSFEIITGLFCLQRCFVVIEFSGVFFNFLNGFLLCLSKKVKEALLISGTVANLSFVGPNRWNITVLFYETIFTDLLATVFLHFKT